MRGAGPPARPGNAITQMNQTGRRPRQDLRAIYAAAFLRSVGVGLTGVLLGVYLSRSGFSATFIGGVIAAGLAGAAVGTLVITMAADRLGRQRTLVGLALFGVVGGLGFALSGTRPFILLFAFLGMLNGYGTDRGPVFSLEQAIIPQLTSAERRTWALSWYALFMDAAHALGALGGALPPLVQGWLHMSLAASYRLTFGLYAAMNLMAALLYLLLSPQVEAAPGADRQAVRAVKISPQTRKVVAKLAALSGLDSLGGGFMSDALLAYWFFLRFGIRESSLGALFFAGHLLNSASYPAAAWLARRIGLLNTMVFTHIPSSLFLMAVPFAPTFHLAVAFFFGREALVEMDVPTRQSYVVGVVQPEERTFSSGIANLTRGIARSISPSFAGYFMQHLALSSPLFIGGAIKIVYDLSLYAAFRGLKPPEEQLAPSATGGRPGARTA